MGPGVVVFGFAPGVVGDAFGFAVFVAGAVAAGAVVVATADGAPGAFFAAVAGDAAVAASGGTRLGGASTG